jgi:hypothetical protein
MSSAEELKAEQFFVSRSGVCVYVTVQRRSFRVQFASVDSHGVVIGQGAGAEAARVAAHAALKKYAAVLAPLFEEVSRRMT